MPAQSEVWVSDLSLTAIAGSNPTDGIDVCILWLLFVLSGSGLYDRLTTRPVESYRIWGVCVWSWNLNDEEKQDHYVGAEAWNIYIYIYIVLSVGWLVNKLLNQWFLQLLILYLIIFSSQLLFSYLTNEVLD